MSECKVSVILPIHNSKPYLKECIESAMNQTLSEIEIICVCGSGNDGSDLMVEEYQKNDNRIIKIDDTNGSYGHKLNVGILASHGEYISILETDDYIEPTMFEILYDIAAKENVDYVDADYKEFFIMDNCEYKIVHKKYYNYNEYNRKLIGKEAKLSGILSDITANWTALYKKDFLINNNLFYHESPGASYQDLGFRVLSNCLVESVYHVNIPLYNYRTDNENSSVKDNKKVFAVQGEYSFVYEQMRNRHIDEEYLWNYYYVWKYRDYFWNTQRLDEEGRNKFLEVYIKELLEDTNAGNIKKEIIEDRYVNCLIKPLEDQESFNKALEESFTATSKRIDILMRIAKQCKGQQVVICGCGIRGKAVNDLLSNEEVVCMCDSNKELHGTKIRGRIVMSYEEATKKFSEAIYVVANKGNYKEIIEKIESMGIIKERIVLYA